MSDVLFRFTVAVITPLTKMAKRVMIINYHSKDLVCNLNLSANAVKGLGNGKNLGSKDTSTVE